ncbi:MOG interacting and ectopic P-granules protein 1-like [Ornithodoros turicata]|uniref:MOG interacting and ectopic P-granules protein 1-like n=1 Tax=Ornithodoros turicata TaxID=34597 RepID=UPI003139B97A
MVTNMVFTRRKPKGKPESASGSEDSNQPSPMAPVDGKDESSAGKNGRVDDSPPHTNENDNPGSERNGVTDENSSKSEASSVKSENMVTETLKEEPRADEVKGVKEETNEEDTIENQENGVTPGLPDFMKGHVKIGKYVPVSMPKTGDFRMEESEALLEAPSLVTPLLVKKPDKFPEREDTKEKKEKKQPPPLGKGGNSVADFFSSSAGEFLIGLGLSRALEVLNKDLVRLKEREMKKTARTPEMVEEHKRLTEAYQQARTANTPFTFKVKPCRVCDFKTESSLVLEGHLLTPHFTSRRELQCSFCSFVTRDAKAIVFHMEAIHNKLPSMEPPPQFYECPFCPYETNLKTKASAHINRCQKYFNNTMNQLPSGDFQPPGVTAKPITVDDVKTYEKFFLALGTGSGNTTKNSQVRSYTTLNRNGAPAVGSGRGVGTPLYQQLASAASLTQNRGRGRPRLALIQPAPVSNQVFQVLSSSSEMIPLLNGSPQLTVTLARATTPQTVATGRGGIPPPRLTPPNQRPRTPVILESSGSGAAFVICEICDGYIKDLEQLRTHMQWIHKVKIHPKMLASRPPLNCQKCQWRFFTDQGLERHLLGAHGLVTSNMQDLANSGQDGGRCTVCGRIYASKLVAHMSQVHRVVLKPAHLSYKCTVCTATFNLYKLFETHVYTVHSGAMKRSSSSADDARSAKRQHVEPGKSVVKSAKVPEQAVAKEVPSTVKIVPISTKEEKKEVEDLPSEYCNTCKVEVDDLESHLKEKHIRPCRVRVCHIEKCDRCLCSFDGMIVFHTSDSGEEESSEEEEDDEESETDKGKVGNGPMEENSPMDVDEKGDRTRSSKDDKISTEADSDGVQIVDAE